MQECYVYILRCADGSYYTGWTNDLDRRLAAHNAGKGAKYTRSRLPATRGYHEVCGSKEEALRREIQIKRMTRSQKEALINKEGVNDDC